jgi:hypothetical protein
MRPIQTSHSFAFLIAMGVCLITIGGTALVSPYEEPYVGPLDFDRDMQFWGLRPASTVNWRHHDALIRVRFPDGAESDLSWPQIRECIKVKCAVLCSNEHLINMAQKAGGAMLTPWPSLTSSPD